MAQSFDPEPLKAFFQEVKEQLGISLKYLPDNPRFPIQLEDPVALSKNKCLDLLNHIKGQVDLRDNAIGKIYPAKTPGKMVIDISREATEALAEVYALTTFYSHDEQAPENEKPKGKPPQAEKEKKNKHK